MIERPALLLPGMVLPVVVERAVGAIFADMDRLATINGRAAPAGQVLKDDRLGLTGAGPGAVLG